MQDPVTPPPGGLLRFLFLRKNSLPAGADAAMKQSDPLQFESPGTLRRPGPIGRVLRLLLGLLCLYALLSLARHWQAIVAAPVSSLANLAILVLAAILLLNYVVNIGFGKSWGRKPLIVSLVLLSGFALVSRVVFGTVEHPMFGYPLLVFLAYFYAHLGISFVVAAVLATPGCEMRALAGLSGRIRGAQADEHHCPAALISRVDAWERSRRG